VGTRLGWIVIATIVPTANACTTTCKEYASAALTIHVRDASGALVCDADVVATDGGEEIALELFPGTECSYAGAWERAGDYVVTAKFDGRTATSERVSVTSGACHVKSKKIDLTLPA